MAKSILKINDELVFFYYKEIIDRNYEPKKDFVKSYFLSNYNKIQLKNIQLNKKIDQVFPRYIPNDLDIEPHFMIEVELTFSGTDRGGILYRPSLNEESSISIDLVEDNYDEDEEISYLKFNVSSELSWDFKSSDFKKFKTHVEQKGSSWENSKLEIRINVRNNPIYLNCLQYDNNGKTIPNGNEDENDIRYILETIENIPSIIKNYSPEKKWEKNQKVWQQLNNYKISFNGSYLEHFNKG